MGEHRAGKADVPLIVDNTFATPVLCRPFEWGADMVVRSTTKYMDGHAVRGERSVIVDGGKFDWAASGKFPDFTEPDEATTAWSTPASSARWPTSSRRRMQLMRDFGCYPAAHSAFLLNLGLETLPVRMRQYCENALTVAKFLESSDKIASVRYPALPGNEHYERAQKYLPMGTSGVMSIDIKGGRAPAMKFMDSLKLACNEVHVADIRTCVLHPASETHRQLTDEQLVAAGIEPGMVRISVGLENVEDIIADLKQALDTLDQDDFIVLIAENVPNTFGYVPYEHRRVAQRHTDVLSRIKSQAHVLTFYEFLRNSIKCALRAKRKVKLCVFDLSRHPTANFLSTAAMRSIKRLPATTKSRSRTPNARLSCSCTARRMRTA